MHETDPAVLSRDASGRGTSEFKILSLNGHLGWPLSASLIQRFNSLRTWSKSRSSLPLVKKKESVQASNNAVN